MTMYERVASKAGGARRLAAARLRYEVLKNLHAALAGSGKNQSELAESLGVRKSAVSQVLRGDGNVRVNTLAEYVHELGFEVTVDLKPAGSARRDAQHFTPRFDLVWTPAAAMNVEKKVARAMDSTRRDFEKAA